MPLRPISSIVVGRRHRRELGDVDSLARSIEAVGLLHPVVVKPDGKLVAGGRRLAACKALGWDRVPVTVVDLAENAHRKDFLPSEIDAIRRKIEPLEKAAARQRMSEGGKVGKISTPSAAGKTRDKIGAFAGVSGKTVAKIATVMEAAESEPERFGHLVEEMDRKRSGVTAAFRKLCQARDADRVLSLAPVAGKFRSLVIDPPWQYDQDMGSGKPKYATMSQAELLALAVADWAEQNCHLYLWTTNAMLPDAIDLTAKWGFRYNTVLTWAKPKYGIGSNFRGQTEHVLFGIRGTLGTRRKDISTLFEAPVGAHSEKPEKFYEIVRAASFPPYGEAFQRKARPDFVNLFKQVAEAAE